MSLLQDAVQAICRASGWKLPHPDAEGAYVFQMQGYSFSVFSPEGRTCIMRAEVCRLPDIAAEQETMLRDFSKRMAAICRKRSSILMMDEESAPARLVLFRSLRMEAGQEQDIINQLTGFLNDLDWWRAEQGATQSASPFSFGQMGATWMGAR